VEDEAEEEDFEAMVVTQENIHQYSIADLILPLLGPQIQLKEGSWLQNAVLDELKALNLTEEDFSHAAKAQNAKAAWRKMLVKPEVIDYGVISHKAPKNELVSPFYTIGEKLDV
jgi:tRNA(Glu) U13 pseudouridine synthase TruD